MSDSNLPRRVEVTAPATVANLGPGFDILGMALAAPFDTILAERTESPGVQIADIHGDDGRLPRDPARNTAGISAAYALRLLGTDQGVRLTLHKGLPLASGLGSSAASAAGGAVAVNALFGNALSMDDLLAAALEGEAAVSGRHADNIAPALYGGITLVTGLDAEHIYRLPVPDDMWLALVTPGVEVPTAKARAALPAHVPLKQMVAQTAGTALLMHAIYSGDLQTMGLAMQMDGVIEPARAHLMPGLEQVRKAAHARGAFGTIISGAGPTLCALCGDESDAQHVIGAMRAVYEGLNIPARLVVTRPSARGVTARPLADNG